MRFAHGAGVKILDANSDAIPVEPGSELAKLLCNEENSEPAAAANGSGLSWPLLPATCAHRHLSAQRPRQPSAVAELGVVRRLATRPVKSALRIGLSLIVGIIAGSVITDYFWRGYFNTLRDAQQLSFTLSAEQQAESAYFNRSPEIAELELTRLLPYLDSPPPLMRTDPHEQPLKRFIAHARLAKVQQAQGKSADAEKHFQTALSNMRSAFPDSKAASADDVLASLAIIDNATRKHQ